MMLVLEQRNQNKGYLDFPCDPLVKMLCFQCRGHGFDSWLGTKIPHAMGHGQKKKREMPESLTNSRIPFSISIM